MKTIVAVLLIGIVLFPSVAWARSEDLPSGFTIQYPDKWISETIGNQTTIYSPDKRSTVICSDFKAENLEAARAKIERKVSNIISDPAYTLRPIESFFNNLPGVMSEGRGVIKEKKVTWVLSLVVCKGTALLTLGYAQSDDYVYHKMIFNKIIHSVRKNKSERGNE